jgi:hypothetical protein
VPSVSEFSFAGGLLMGLASSLHCAGMCGGIGASLLFMLDPKAGTATRARLLMTAQAARVLAYVLAGAIIGLVGSAGYGAFDREIGYRVLQWGAAVTLGWIGLSVAGLVPPIAALDRLTLPLTRRLQAAGGGGGLAAPVSAGLVWGLMPCAMVYAALFTAMLTGTAQGGAVVMAGFGLGTLPAVTVSALGLTGLAAAARGPQVRVAVGLAIAAFGVATLVLSMPGGPLCITG